MCLQGLMHCPVWRQSSISDGTMVSNSLLRRPKKFTNILDALGRHARVLGLYTRRVGNVGMFVTTRQNAEWQVLAVLRLQKYRT